MLTQREKEVLKLAIEGKTNKEIASILNITFHTAKAHLEHIYEKTNIHSRYLLAIHIFYNNINLNDL